MINFTPIARIAMSRRAAQAASAACDCENTQRRVLDWLLTKGKKTEWGKQYDFAAIKSYEDYCQSVPINEYEAFRPYAMRMVDGEADVLWPGRCRRFAQSSGTSGGKSKYIPVTSDSLRCNHYPGASTSVATYIASYPDSRMFAGKGLILGGSFANELDVAANVKVGDLSANLIDAINPVVNLFRVPNKEIALMSKWEEKLPALVEASISEDVTNLSGVPSWFLTVLKRVLDKSGKTNIADVWRNLEVFFYGGISFKPYVGEYAKIMPAKMRYWQTYNASEGFFACQAGAGDDSMLLLQDVGVFYEFLPLDQLDDPNPKAIPAWKVEQGKTYALVITAPNGLWRYMIGDTVKIESVEPLKISIAGRTNSYINVFGEELMVYNADAALQKTCAALNCSISNYTAAPVYTQGNDKGHHQWLIEWLVEPSDINEFAKTLDKALQQENSDYQAKRQDDIFLANLTIVSAQPGLFDRWLASTGKLGGQRKIPRLRNDRTLIESMLKMNEVKTTN